MLQGNTFALRCHPFHFRQRPVLLSLLLWFGILITAVCSVVTSKRLSFLLQPHYVISSCHYCLLWASVDNIYSGETVLSSMQSTLFLAPWVMGASLLSYFSFFSTEMVFCCKRLLFCCSFFWNKWCESTTWQVSSAFAKMLQSSETCYTVGGVHPQSSWTGVTVCET